MVNIANKDKEKNNTNKQEYDEILNFKILNIHLRLGEIYKKIIQIGRNFYYLKTILDNFNIIINGTFAEKDYRITEASQVDYAKRFLKTPWLHFVVQELETNIKKIEKEKLENDNQEVVRSSSNVVPKDKVSNSLVTSEEFYKKKSKKTKNNKSSSINMMMRVGESSLTLTAKIKSLQLKEESKIRSSDTSDKKMEGKKSKKKNKEHLIEVDKLTSQGERVKTKLNKEEKDYYKKDIKGNKAQQFFSKSITDLKTINEELQIIEEDYQDLRQKLYGNDNKFSDEKYSLFKFLLDVIKKTNYLIFFVKEENLNPFVRLYKKIFKKAQINVDYPAMQKSELEALMKPSSEVGEAVDIIRKINTGITAAKSYYEINNVLPQIMNYLQEHIQFSLIDKLHYNLMVRWQDINHILKELSRTPLPGEDNLKSEFFLLSTIDKFIQELKTLVPEDIDFDSNREVCLNLVMKLLAQNINTLIKQLQENSLKKFGNKEINKHYLKIITKLIKFEKVYSSRDSMDYIVTLLPYLDYCGESVQKFYSLLVDESDKNNFKERLVDIKKQLTDVIQDKQHKERKKIKKKIKNKEKNGTSIEVRKTPEQIELELIDKIFNLIEGIKNNKELVCFDGQYRFDHLSFKTTLTFIVDHMATLEHASSRIKKITGLSQYLDYFTDLSNVLTARNLSLDDLTDLGVLANITLVGNQKSESRARYYAKVNEPMLKFLFEYYALLKLSKPEFDIKNFNIRYDKERSDNPLLVRKFSKIEDSAVGSKPRKDESLLSKMPEINYLDKAEIEPKSHSELFIIKKKKSCLSLPSSYAQIPFTLLPPSGPLSSSSPRARANSNLCESPRSMFCKSDNDELVKELESRPRGNAFSESERPFQVSPDGQIVFLGRKKSGFTEAYDGLFKEKLGYLFKKKEGEDEEEESPENSILNHNFK
ncbi:MAG: hypothetical protein Q8M40_08095 [Legionella sp.]|nr:hypothetical protein [Legionella sp.]